jgi:hypothetical protein
MAPCAQHFHRALRTTFHGALGRTKGSIPPTLVAETAVAASPFGYAERAEICTSL